VLRPLSVHTHPNLIIGLNPGDDAAVYLLNDTHALVQTLDFFPPIVDDPYTFGAIAAANSMSDVYAMAGTVALALNIVAFPSDLDKAILSAILQGGLDKVNEAGGIIAGGHTVTDPEPKYGLCVTGLADPQRIMSKAGARPGDRLILTKPLGTGVITTAAKNDRATPAHLQGAVDWMLRLNGPASRVLCDAGIKACTDITGFGLLGHASEMAQAGRVLMRISASAVPVLDGALEYVRQKQVPGGTGRNREYLIKPDLEPEAAHPTGHQTEVRVRLNADIPRDAMTLLFDPQTSGGLFAAVPPGLVPEVRARLEDAGVPMWEVGEVDEGLGIVVEG
ncbi:MAG: selenide, water dikinase SelD, partial [Chloroflexota bacterium]|nr:selenide, water dikinase SelD [Chloroflexota bacterium]